MPNLSATGLERAPENSSSAPSRSARSWHITYCMRSQSDSNNPGCGRRTFLTASAGVAAATAVAAPGQALGNADHTSAYPGSPHSSVPPGRQLRQLLAQVDPDRLESSVRTLAGFGTRHTLSAADDPHRGIDAARDWIFNEMQRHAEHSDGRMTVELQSFTQPPADRIPRPSRITNVVATVQGQSTPERVHVITGHYDTRASDPMDATSDAPGADDDGSGVAALLELARVLAAEPLESTIVLAAVAGEEQGLRGSRHLAEQFAAARTDLRAMLNNDTIGSSTAEDGTRDRHTIRLFAEGVPTAETPQERENRQSIGGENDSASRQLARFITATASNDATGMRVRTIHRRDRYLRSGDHIPFLEQHWPAVRFTEPHEDYRHQHQDVRTEQGTQYGDLPEFCDFDFLARATKVNLAVVWSLAQAPGAPVDVQIRAQELTNDTTLVWQRGPEPDLAGYEVVWRETTEADWSHAIDVGDVTTATIALSKDNVFFGLRAVDHDGHRSPVAFPSPLE